MTMKGTQWGIKSNNDLKKMVRNGFVRAGVSLFSSFSTVHTDQCISTQTVLKYVLMVLFKNGS